MAFGQSSSSLNCKRTADKDVDTLRKLSRWEYLKERETKQFRKLGDDIAEEERLFMGQKLSASEKHKLRHKKEVYELLKKKRADEEDAYYTEYKMPEAYDRQGGVSQENRFSVAMQRDPFSAEKTKNPQEAWENNQIEKATLRFGSKNKHLSKSYEYDYPLLFEDQIDYIKANCFADGESSVETISELPKGGGSLQEERKTLPIFAYRDELLQAIDDHQIVVIVGETGSGKTTQIPQFLHEAGYTTKHGKIGCTQPRRVAAMSVAARVSKELGVKLGHEVGYSIRFEDCTSHKTILKYMTDGMLLSEFLLEPDLASYSVVMVDEAHERTLSTDILFGLLKNVCRFRPDFKLLISSATLDAQKFSDYFDYAPLFVIPGRRFPVETLYTPSPVADYLDAAIVTVLQIHIRQPPGHILVFLNGQEEIETAEEILKCRTRSFGTKIAELIILPIYSTLPSELQSNIFKATPQGARKVVLATNIAETSLTIDGIKYVVDPGYSKINSYSPKTGTETLLVTPISKASANQRKGRAGRTGPGKCFRLYTQYTYTHEMDENTVPEVLRTDLSSVILTLKSLGIPTRELLEFDFMDRPADEALWKAIGVLWALGALNEKGEELTQVGVQMARLPVNPMVSKMIVASNKYKCSEEVITIAAMLSVGNAIFYRPKDKKVHADNARLNFHAGNVGDHLAFLKIYNCWKENGYLKQWCKENYIQATSMKRARDTRDQLKGLLERADIKLASSNDLEAIQKSIVAGFFPNAAQLQKCGSYKTVKQPQTVYIHPSSGLAGVLPRWVIYDELVLTTKAYARQVTQIKPEWLLEVAPHFYETKDVQAGILKMPRGPGRSAL